MMTKLSLTRLGVAVGGLTVSLTTGAGVASAGPDLGPAVNTTCTYDQFVAALNAQDPTIAQYFDSSPEMQSGLRQFLAGSPSQRRQWAQQIASDPANQPYLGVIQGAFNTCNNY
jgi:hemophore-related protein